MRHGRVLTLLYALTLAFAAVHFAGCTAGNDCRGQFARSQGITQPCCPGWGVDACGAGLFCAAFDGRTQATCYPNYSRLDGEQCTADNQCLSMSCNSSLHRCRWATAATPCDPCVGCAALGGMRRYCDTTMVPAVCIPGTVDTESNPACAPVVDAGASDVEMPDGGQIQPAPTNMLDLLVEIDNSNSMRENQTNLMASIGRLFTQLAGMDVHLGVISTDLGTAGSTVPGCANSTAGDDGQLNPIRNGLALRAHEPWLTAPPVFGRPTDCTNPNQFPSFLSFSSGSASDHDIRCNIGLYVNGCGLEQQLESIRRALIENDASDSPGNTSTNAGFLRADALLAILVLSDEEDGSVRDCAHAGGMDCADATDVFSPTSISWATAELNMRFYMYEPGGPQDPTWPLDRYFDHRSAANGLLGLKPGHPERVLFAAITGIPLALSGTHQWDDLLGTPSAGGPDDFTHRYTTTLGSMSSAEGPISMMQANADPGCSQRVVPACRRQYSAPSTGCTTTDQYFAWPGRRIVEIARRFDQSTLCGGRPCSNGIVYSICSNDYTSAIDSFAQRITYRAAGN